MGAVHKIFVALDLDHQEDRLAYEDQQKVASQEDVIEKIEPT